MILDRARGTLVKYFEKSGWEVENEDISYEKVESRLIMNGHRPVLNYPDDYFDAVSLWYVIEHMVDPRSTLNEIKRVLRPGGVLILSQQNFDSIQANLFGPCWLILDPPRHVYQFSPSNLCMLAEQHGFWKIGIEHSCLEMGPFTILQSTLNKLLGNGNYLFKLLKNRKLRIKAIEPEERERIILLGVLSIVLSVVLAPLSMLTYHLLLRTGSGDVFTLALKNQGH